MIRALLLVLIGCGRIGFDEQSGGPPVLPVETDVPGFTTTSSTFVEVPGSTVTLPPSPGTRWLILVSGSLLSASFKEIGVEARYLIDGIERGIGGTQANQLDRPGPWQHFCLHEGTDTPAQITVELRDGTGAAAVIEDLRIVAVPLPAGAEGLYAAADPEQVVMTPTFEPLVTLTVNPTTPGEYVFLLLANTSDAPSRSDIHTQWRAPDGQYWTSDLHMPRSAWQSHLFVRRTTLGAGPASLVFEVNATGSQARFSYVRALALRVDGFPSFEVAQDATLRSTTSSASTVTNRLDPIGGARQFLYLAAVLMRADCTNTSPADRGIHLSIDGNTESFRHVTENCSYETTYGAAHLLPRRPAQLEVGFSSGNAEIVVYQESSLLLIGLD